MVTRRDFLKLSGIGLAALLFKPKPPKKRKKKMTIAFDNSSNSGLFASPSTNAGWEHIIRTSGRYPGLVVGVSIFTTGVTVTSVVATHTTTKDLSFVRADTNGAYRSEIWCGVTLPDINPGEALIAFDFIVTFSGACDSICGAASFSYFGGIGTHGGATGTGDPAAKALTPNWLNSIILSNLTAQSASGILNADNQDSRWDVPNAVGTSMGSDKGPVNPIASTTLQFNGITAGHVWAQSSVELLSYQDNPPAIMGM